MSEIIDKAIDVFEQQIQALYTNDFEKFKSYMSPHVRNELTLDIFQKAIDLYKHTPIGREAIDLKKSSLYNEGESAEIPDRHVKLILVGSGRTLCHIVEIKGEWLVDDIYWRVEDEENTEEDQENNQNDPSTEEEDFSISEKHQSFEDGSEISSEEEIDEEPLPDENNEEDESTDE